MNNHSLAKVQNINTNKEIPEDDKNDFKPYLDPVYAHEYGHYLQSQSSGWNYLIKYGIPSLIDFHKNKNNTIFYYDRYGKSHETNKHDVHYAEIDANKRAAQYFKDKNVLFYDNTGWNYERIKPTYAVVY